MENSVRYHRRRKSAGPRRSTTPLDNFLNPGVIFRFPSDLAESELLDGVVSGGGDSNTNTNTDTNTGTASENKNIKMMPAAFISACSPSPQGNCAFLNISSFDSYVLDFVPRSPQSVELSSPENDTDIFLDLRSTISSASPVNSISTISETSSGTSVTAPSTSSNAKRKRCDSCGTRKTPYWRDGWQGGVVLCNACGIRYHKYKKYCETCLCIARKNEKGRLVCPKCIEPL